MSDVDNVTMRQGASHYAGKILASGRFAMLQVCIVSFLILTLSGILLVVLTKDTEIRQFAFAIIGFVTAQVGTVFGFYLRGGSTEA